MMKRLILLIVTMALFTYPSICLASYLVQLTNGNQFITYGYWEDGARIRFYSGGGAVAVAKASVSMIKEMDIAMESQTDIRSIISSPKAPEMLPEEDGPEGETSAGQRSADTIISLDDYKEKKLRLRAQLNKALEGFREASRNRDSKAKKKAIRDVTAASGQMLKLTDEVKEKNNGVLPDWWEGL
jgi:hypothetical protein